MVQISEVGLVTSVGRDATTTFSSIMAGITRPKELPYFSFVDPELQAPEPVVGHPIEALTEGFHLFGLWMRLAVASLNDLVARAGLPLPGDTSAWSRTGLIAVLPDIRSYRFLSDGSESDDDVRAPFLNRIATLLGTPQSEPMLHVVCNGRLGVVEALEHGEELLTSGNAERVIVMAVDSLLDSLTLEWLGAAQRVKSGGVAAGLTPGEAGAALLLESASGHSADGSVSVRALAKQGSAKDDASNEARGRFLESALAPCIAGFNNASGRNCLWINDQNGEQWRAEELAYCALYMGERWPADLEVMLPALSIGDTGAASGVLALALAVMALRDELVPAQQCLISSSSYEGSVAAALLETA